MGTIIYEGLNYNHACYKIHKILGEELEKNLEIKYSDNLLRCGFYLDGHEIAYHDSKKDKLVVYYKNID